MLQDQLAQRRRRRTDRGGVAADAIERPVGVTPVAGGHVLLHGRVLAVAARAQMGGDPLALGEYLDGTAGEPDLDLGAGEAMRHAVIMPVDIDVIIDADTAGAPFGEHVGLGRQGLERRPVELFEQLAPRHAEPPDRALVVEPRQQLGDGLVQLAQAVELPIAQAAENPALHDQHADFDLGLVARPARPCRQHGGVVMRRHLRIGPVDLRLVQARLDDRGLGVVRHEQPGHAADRLEGARVGADPVGEPLRPRRLRIGEVRGAQDGDEYLRLPDLAGQPVDHHRHACRRRNRRTACRRPHGSGAS